VVHGLSVAGFGVVILVLYVDVSAAELGIFAAACAGAYAIEGLVAGAYMRRAARPVSRWLASDRDGEGAPRVWSTAARLPLDVLRLPVLYATGAAGAFGVALVAAALLDLPAYHGALLLPALLFLYVYSGVLRYVGLELCIRPVLAAIGPHLDEPSPPALARVSLHRRLLATVPMVSWGTGIIVTGFLTDNSRDLERSASPASSRSE
jgi:hypothetical protein